MPVVNPAEIDKQPLLTIPSPAKEANGQDALTDVEELTSEGELMPQSSPVKVKKKADSEEFTDDETIECSDEEFAEKEYQPIEIQRLLPDTNEVLSLTEGFARVSSPLWSDNENFNVQDIEGRHIKNVKRTTDSVKVLNDPEVPEDKTDEENMSGSEHESDQPTEDHSTLPVYYLQDGKSISSHEMVKSLSPVSKNEFGSKKKKTLQVFDDAPEAITDVEELPIEKSEKLRNDKSKRRKPKRRKNPKTVDSKPPTLYVPSKTEEGVTDVEILPGDSSSTSESSEDSEDNITPHEQRLGLTDTEDVYDSDINEEDLVTAPIPKEDPPVIPDAYQEKVNIRENEDQESNDESVVETDEEGFQLDDQEDKRPLIMPVVNYDLFADEPEGSDYEEDVKEAQTDLDDIDMEEKEDEDIIEDMVQRIPQDDSDVLLKMDNNEDFVSNTTCDSKKSDTSIGNDNSNLAADDEHAEGATDIEEWDEQGSITKVKRQVKKPQRRSDSTDSDTLPNSDQETQTSKNRSKKRTKGPKRLPLVPQISDVRFIETDQGPLSIIITPDSTNKDITDNVHGVIFLEPDDTDDATTDIEYISDIPVSQKPLSTVSSEEPEAPLTDTEDIEDSDPAMDSTTTSPLPPNQPFIPSPKREKIHIVEDEFGIPHVKIEDLHDDDLDTVDETQQARTDVEDLEASDNETIKVGDVGSDGESSNLLATLEPTEVSTKTKSKKNRKHVSNKRVEESGHTDIEELSPYRRVKRKGKAAKKTFLEHEVGDESGNTEVEVLDESNLPEGLVLSDEDQASHTDYESFEDSEDNSPPQTIILPPTPDVIRKSAIKRTIVYKEVPGGSVKTEVQEENHGSRFLALGDEPLGTTDVEEVEISESEEAKEEPSTKDIPVSRFLDQDTSRVSVSVKSVIPHSKEKEETEIKDNLLLPDDTQGTHTEIESLDEGEGNNRNW